MCVKTEVMKARSNDFSEKGEYIRGGRPAAFGVVVGIRYISEKKGKVREATRDSALAPLDSFRYNVNAVVGACTVEILSEWSSHTTNAATDIEDVRLWCETTVNDEVPKELIADRSIVAFDG